MSHAHLVRASVRSSYQVGGGRTFYTPDAATPGKEKTARTAAQHENVHFAVAQAGSVAAHITFLHPKH